MKKIIFIILIGVGVSTMANAQGNITLSYSIGFATGDLHDFISEVSFRGTSLDYRYPVSPNMAVGINVAWNTFYEEKDWDTYSAGNASLTGKQFRYSNHVPILATFTYFSKPDEMLNPFVSLGIGTMYSRRNTDMNLYTLKQDTWNFLLQPEVGVQIMTSDHTAISISAKYNHGFEAGNDLENIQSFIALNVGVNLF